jgi:hypothetical protein
MAGNERLGACVGQGRASLTIPVGEAVHDMVYALDLGHAVLRSRDSSLASQRRQEANIASAVVS